MANFREAFGDVLLQRFTQAVELQDGGADSRQVAIGQEPALSLGSEPRHILPVPVPVLGVVSIIELGHLKLSPELLHLAAPHLGNGALLALLGPQKDDPKDAKEQRQSKEFGDRAA